MKFIRLLLFWLLLPTSNLASGLDQGSICIPPLPGSSSAISEPAMTPPGKYISPNSTLLIQVDKGKPITVSPSLSGAIKGLSLKGKHLLKIRHDGSLVTSFSFSFEKEGVKDLCLWYYKGYGTFSLKPAKECNCGK